MLSGLESTTMFSLINDSTGLKAVSINNTMKTKNTDNQLDPVALSSSSVSFSDTSKQLDLIKNSLTTVDEVTTQKIAHIKAEIDTGTYQINSMNIAKKMMNR